jgi:hypothetical protein
VVPDWLPDGGIGGCELAPRVVRDGDDIGYDTGPRPGLSRSYEPGSLHIGWGIGHGVVVIDRTRSRGVESVCFEVSVVLFRDFVNALFDPCLVVMGEVKTIIK